MKENENKAGTIRRRGGIADIKAFFQFFFAFSLIRYLHVYASFQDGNSMCNGEKLILGNNTLVQIGMLIK